MPREYTTDHKLIGQLATERHQRTLMLEGHKQRRDNKDATPITYGGEIQVSLCLHSSLEDGHKFYQGAGH